MGLASPSTPRATADPRVLVLGYLFGAAADFLAGTLELRYCRIPFAGHCCWTSLTLGIWNQVLICICLDGVCGLV